jgi:hypothetical protein
VSSREIIALARGADHPLPHRNFPQSVLIVPAVVALPALPYAVVPEPAVAVDIAINGGLPSQALCVGAWVRSMVVSGRGIAPGCG